MSRRALLVCSALILVAACGGDEEEESPFTAGLNASFVADASPDCPRADLLSLQRVKTLGSAVTLDIVLTDCDGSLDVSGVAFEFTFDPAIIDYVGCSPGALFSNAPLVPGTPQCFESGGNLIGTIAVQPPLSLQVGSGGTADIARLTFNIRRKTTTPARIEFVGIDSINSTAVFLVDPNSNPVVHTLGAGGYATGGFVAN